MIEMYRNHVHCETHMFELPSLVHFLDGSHFLCDWRRWIRRVKIVRLNLLFRLLLDIHQIKEKRPYIVYAQLFRWLFLCISLERQPRVSPGAFVWILNLDGGALRVPSDFSLPNLQKIRCQRQSRGRRATYLDWSRMQNSLPFYDGSVDHSAAVPNTGLICVSMIATISSDLQPAVM
jgi:hypothetical protein